jgi:hypothetical protein
MLAGLLVLMLAACSTDATVVSDSRARMGRLRDAVSNVAEAQHGADTQLSLVVSAVRDLEETVLRLRDAETVDVAVEEWPDISSDWPDDGAEPAREALRQVALEVDDARLVLVAVRAERTDEWERSYLDAQDAVLAAVRTYAEAADRLAQVVELHWEELVEIHDLVDSFVERRWFFRTDAEATQAFEVEVDDLVRPLDKAVNDVAAVTGQREAAAAAVNEATELAQDLWLRRPQPTS